MVDEKSTYEELEQKIADLSKQLEKCKKRAEKLREI